ncbi:DUF6473 family protein [Marivivens marinus]|uniref:DUF6473 family protein n=1 Tax=Marivivens marinus TaxID=3110173 RepID=UPI003B849E53
MKHEPLGESGLSYAPCRYGMSRVTFRGPRRDLNGRYISFIGGTETYGKFIEHPFPTLVETALGEKCVNFGVVNAGIDVFHNDPTILAAAHDAELTVVQIMGAHNLSNRFYKVHPRRNDRFLSASTVMKALFSDVDFADFSFTRHLLGALYTRAPERFEILRSELEQAWLARMKSLIAGIGDNVVLLWLSDSPLTDDPWMERPNPLRADPLFVTRSMVEQLRPLVRDVIEAQPSAEALSRGTEGMVFPLLNNEAATEMLGVAAHEEAAARIAPALRRLMGKPTRH